MCIVSNVLKYIHCVIFATSTKQVLTLVKNCSHDVLLVYVFVYRHVLCVGSNVGSVLENTEIL